eukprot:gene38503-52016_t
MSASDNKITRMSQGPRVARVGLTVALLTVLLVGGGCTVTACSTTVESGDLPGSRRRRRLSGCPVSCWWLATCLAPKGWAR